MAGQDDEEERRRQAAAAGAPRVSVTPSGATIVAPQPTSYAETDSSTTRQRTVRSAQAALAEGAALNAADEQADAEIAIGEAKAKKEDAVAAGLDTRAAERERAAKEKADRWAAVEPEYKKRKAEADQWERDAASTKLDDSDEATVGQLVGMALAGLGSAIAGRGAEGAQQAHQIIIAKNERRRQIAKEALDRKWQRAKAAGASAEAIRDGYDRDVARLDAESNGRLLAIADRAEAATARTGRESMIAEGAREAAKIRAFAAQRKAENEKDLQERVTSSYQSKTRLVEGGGAGNSGMKANELAVLDPTGQQVIGQARSAKIAGELSEKRTALETGLKTADGLLEHIDKHGTLIPLIDGDHKQTRQAFINRMLEAKKAITGAINEGDVARAGAIYDTSLTRGAAAAKSAIGVWKQGLVSDYTASVKSGAIPLEQPVPMPGWGNRLEQPRAKEESPSAPQRAGDNVERKTLANGKRAIKIGGRWLVEN